MRKQVELHGSLEKVLPPPHSFGQSIAVNDNYTVVGADDLSMHNTKECGGIYIFDKYYDEVQYFYTDRDKSFYGWDVAITDDDTIIVGADDEDNVPLSSCNGSAFVFKKGECGFYIHKKLFAEHHAIGSYFGYAVACNKTHVAISAPCYQSSNNLSRPYVYIYDLENFELCHTLTIDHPTLPNIYSSFGCNIEFSDKYLVITEHTYGRINVYDAKTFKPIRLYMSVGNPSSIDLNGDLLVVGNPKNRSVGLIDIKEDEVLFIHYNEDISNYGYKVALNNNILAVTSNKNTEYLYDNVVMDEQSEGKLFLYEINGKDLELIEIRDTFYQSLKFHDNKLYCGNPIANDLYGVVDVYTS